MLQIHLLYNLSSQQLDNNVFSSNFPAHQFINMKRLIIFILFASQLTGCAGLGALALGSIVYYTSSQHKVATVNIQAKADNVYRVAIDTIKSAPELEITSKDEQERVIEFVKQTTNDSYAVSIKISELDAEHSQLILASDASKDNDINIKPMQQGIFRFCSELKVECHLSKP